MRFGTVRTQLAPRILNAPLVGLIELTADGTYERDIFGNPIETYDTEDIGEFAKCWTGFSLQSTVRANLAWPGAPPRLCESEAEGVVDAPGCSAHAAHPHLMQRERRCGVANGMPCPTSPTPHGRRG